jgi:hypothetical protein
MGEIADPGCNIVASSDATSSDYNITSEDINVTGRYISRTVTAASTTATDSNGETTPGIQHLLNSLACATFYNLDRFFILPERRIEIPPARSD